MVPPEDVIRSFWSALGRRDVARARTFLAAEPDALRVAGIRGRGGAGYGLGLAALMFTAGSPLQVLAVVGNRVVVERHAFVTGTMPRAHPHVILGLARVQDGRITSWEEYWDSRLVVRPKERAERAAERPPRETRRARSSRGVPATLS